MNTDSSALLDLFRGTLPVVTDGAWGTELQARGLRPGECPEGWNIQQPDQVESVARGYVEAGSQVILTNSFGGSRLTLASHGLADKVRKINRLAAEISRRAAGDRARVFASIGPSGKLLLMGDVSEEELQENFEEQAAALAEGGAEAIVIETMSDLEEAQIAIAAAAQTGLPVIGCMSFSQGKERDRTMMGVTPEQAAAAMIAAGAAIVGANCGSGAADYTPVCRRLREATGRPVWLKPNAGTPSMEGDRTVYSTGPDVFATEALELVRAGAGFIGGCCGTNPAFIQALVTALKTGGGRAARPVES